MNKQMWGWIVGVAAALVVIVVGFRLWQGYMTGSQAGAYGTEATTATSTNGAEATTTKSAPVSVQKRTGTVLSIVASLSDASKFQAVWASSGIAAKLKGKGPYTIFVPNDEAFNYLAPGTLLNMTAAEKLRLVEYHFVPNRALDITAAPNGSIQALSGDALNFTVDINDHTAQVGSGWALQEFKATNGVVYVISQVLLPPTKTQ